MVAHQQHLWRHAGGQSVRRVHRGPYDEACSYMYGYAKAYDDATIRGISNPAAYLWWLDVETGNSWSPDTGANRADLEGMAAYFASIGATTGLYSTGRSGPRLSGLSPRRATCTRCPAGWPGRAHWHRRNGNVRTRR